MKSVLFSDVKRFTKNGIGRIYLLQIFTIILFLIIAIRAEHINASLIQEIEKTNKKVDFRYFNITRSLEDIHNVRIDTLNGAKRG